MKEVFIFYAQQTEVGGPSSIECLYTEYRHL